MSHLCTRVLILSALVALVGYSEGKSPVDFNNWKHGGCPVYGINECQYFEGSIDVADNVEYAQEFFVDTLHSTENFNVSNVLEGDNNGLRLVNNPSNRLTIEHNANFSTTLHLMGTGATRTPLVLANDLTRVDATAAGEVTLKAATTKIPGTLHVHGSVTRGGTQTCSINNPHVGQLNGGIKFGPTGETMFKEVCDPLGGRGDAQMSHMVTSKISGAALDLQAAAPIDYQVNSVVKMTTSTTQAQFKTTDTVLGGTGGNKLFNGNGKLDINAPTSISLKVGTSTEAGKVEADVYSIASGTLQVGETTGALGVCNVANRGTLAAIYGGTGVGDIYYICMKNAADAYVWLPVSPASAGPIGPKGNKGVKGATGIKGVKGAKGAKGTQGPVGPQGPTGDQGNQGIQGDKQNKGLTGPTGPTGPKGQKGNTGAKGNTGFGPTGDKGNAGVQQQCSGLGSSIAIGPNAYFYHETLYNWVRTTTSCTPDASWDHTDHRNFAMKQLDLKGPAESYWRCPGNYDSLQRGRLCISTAVYANSYYGAMNSCASLSGGHICTELELKTAGTAVNIGWTGYSYTGPGNYCLSGMWLDSASAANGFITNSGDCVNNENVDGVPSDKNGVRTFRCCL